MAGPKITRRPQNYYFVRVGQASALGLSGTAAQRWNAVAALLVQANEIRVMDFDPGTPSAPEESESSYGDDQAFTFSGAEQSGTASIQILDATASDGRLTTAQAAAAKTLIDAAVDANIEIVRLRSNDVTRESDGDFPSTAPTWANSVAYYFRGKKRNPRAIDGSPMDRYAMDIVLSQRPDRIEHAA